MKNNTSKAFSIRKQEWNTNNYHFPGIVYLDANPILDVVKNRRYGSLVEEYWAKLYDNNGMITWSDHTEEEILRVLHRSEYEKYAEFHQIEPELNSDGKVKKQPWKVAEDNVTEVEASEISQAVYESKLMIFKNIGQYGTKLESPSLTKVNNLTQQLYLNYGGSYDDAKHISFSNLGGINNILTHDSGMLKYPNQNIFGASKNVVQQYNTSQSPAEYISLSELTNQKDIAEGS